MRKQHVIVYISDDCEACDHLVEFLRNHKVNFTMKNTSEDKVFLKELQQKNIYVTPAVLIGDSHKILGFDKEKLRRILGF